MNSSRAATPRVGNKATKPRQRARCKRNRPKKATPNPTLIMGPITREKREKHKPAPRINTTPSKKTAKCAEKIDTKRGCKLDWAVAESLALRGLLIAIDAILVATFLIHLFPLKSILSIIQRARNEIDVLSTRNLVAASQVEDAALGNPAMHAVIKYAKMASLPFLLFTPALFVLTILSLTEGKEGNHQSVSEKRKGRRRVLSLLSVCTGMLFAFLTVLIACAEAGRWLLLGVISFVTPAILMVLTELSVIYGGPSGGFSWVGQGWTWCRQVDMTTVAKLIGFVFIFLPFLAGFFYAISPPFLLAVPLSSLTTCSLAGVFGLRPFVLAAAFLIIGWNAGYWTLAKLFHAYSWVVKRHCSTLLFLTCLALFVATLQLQLPSYL